MRKKIVSILFLLFLLAGLTGCAKKNDTEEKDSLNTQKGQETEESGKMGRYMETEYDMSDMLSRPGELVKMEDGTYIIFDYNNGFLISKDEGVTWENKEQEWFLKLNDTNYIMDMAVSPKGEIVYAVEPYSEEESENAEEEDDFSLNPIYYYVGKDGSQTVLNLPYSSENRDYISKFYYSPKGELYGVNYDGKLFAINPEEDSVKVIYESGESIRDVVFFEEEMILCYRSGQILFHPQTKQTEQPDELLKDFIDKETPEDKYDYSDMKKLILQQGEDENTLYIVFDKGLYRYVKGESTIEQIIDGSLCTLGDPSTGLIDMELLADGRFMILYQNTKLICYTYDETIASVPSNVIAAYSLRENQVLRQAITNYQKKNPDVYVKYEIGMDDDSGITREDALKKLNTKIMAGEGPDLLLMDGLPVDSYVQKGILADISPYITELEQKNVLLENIVNCYKEEDKIYMLPAEISIMLTVGEQASISQIQNLKTLADEVENIRKQYSDGSLLGYYTEKIILLSLLGNDMPVLIAEDGTINEVALSEFLTQAKRIYQAETAGISKEIIDDYKKYMDSRPNEELKYIMGISSTSFGMATGESRLAVGSLGDFDWDLGSIVSLKDLNKNLTITQYHGMADNVFRPDTVAAINAKSEKQDMAGELFLTLLSKETLSLSVGNGFAINKEALQENINSRNGNDGDIFGSIATSDEEGNYFTMDIRGATQEEIDMVYQILESVDTPNFGYDVMENAILELGVDALNGSRSVEDTVSEIIKKVAIYLAE